MNKTEALATELEELERALAQPDLDRRAEVAMLERVALIRARIFEASVAEPYVEVSDEDLAKQLEDAEVEREDLLPRVRAAVEDRARRPALAAKMDREHNERAEIMAGLRREVDRRRMAAVNDTLATWRAGLVAERELQAEDEAALAGLEDDWRRGKAAEQMAASRDKRLEAHKAVVHERLLIETEAKVAAQLFMPGPGHEPTPMPTQESVEEEEVG